MSIDVARARAETPGTFHVVHLNNAGSALPPQPVTEAVYAHLALEEEIGGYEAAARNAEGVERTYAAVSRLLGCGTDEVALVESATVAWALAFQTLEFQPGDRILTGTAEYASNVIAFLQATRRSGAVVEVVPDDADGQTDVTALDAMIDERVKLIALTHIPTNGGLVNPAASVGGIARMHGVPYLLDACQAAGQMPLDVNELGCDFLTATGRKFLRGPRGTGFLYVRRDRLEGLEPRVLDLHGATLVTADRYEPRPDARRFEYWESNVAARIGLGVAVDYALDWGLDAIRERVWSLGGWLRTLLDAIPGVTLRDRGAERCGIVTFTVEGVDPDAVKAAVGAKGFNVSVSRASSTRFDMDGRGLASVVRASPHYYNTEAELELFAEAVAALVP